jgi:hypothetical protein
LKEGKDGLREVRVEHPSYSGPDRRMETLTVGPCDCHKKHEKVLADHDCRINKLEEHHSFDTGEIYKEMRTKTPMKLFYFIVGLFFMAVLATLGTILMNIHSVDKAVAVIAVQVSANSKFNEKIEKSVEAIKHDINVHMLQQNRRDTETDEYRRGRGISD